MSEQHTKETRDIFVIAGFYPDKSGAKLFGAYELLRTAEDRVKLMEAGGSFYALRVVKLSVNEASPQELF
jgi:hypothetical protein